MAITMANDEVIEFMILEDDLNELKRLRIARSPISSYITFTSEFI